MRFVKRLSTSRLSSYLKFVHTSMSKPGRRDGGVFPRPAYFIMFYKVIYTTQCLEVKILLFFIQYTNNINKNTIFTVFIKL